MSSSDTAFKGYGITDANRWSDFKLVEIKPKTWEEEDIDVAVSYCGVCGSDIHTITGGWGSIQELPLVVGHEIAGTVVRVGSIAAQKTGIKVGDRVGIGARCNACGNGRHPDGTMTQGGYSTAVRANHQYVFPIPDGIALEDAASMMCAGLTMYSPLTHNGAGPGKKVGIIGLGAWFVDFGHYGVLFAKALGCDVYVFSHSTRKEQDALKMGADHFVVSEDKENMARLRGTLDLIVSTVNVVDTFPLAEYLSLLVVRGTFINVGAPETKLPQLAAFDFTPNACRLGGSCVGSKREAIEMLWLLLIETSGQGQCKALDRGTTMSKVKQVAESMKAGDARYRFVLQQDIV
ncbi:GroES-like protein [Rhizoctonia solani]|uniref:GroES-like protein n=1 Tax=Rhizoctonia solani TaxID=456999 RepID=A0A8H7I856_9AGAM|nr:GroES-like protein [Rhizoctonia solani]